jgi:redox-sensitive bicupin YhaK (pirin superfamily)
LPPAHNVFVYLYDGEMLAGENKKALPQRAAGLLGDGEQVRFEAGQDGAGALLLAGKPLHESIVQYGPFVMNTRNEIEQAISDYQSGRLSREQIGQIRID